MVCYVNGVAPSMGNVQTDSVKTGNDELSKKFTEIQKHMQQALIEKRVAEQRKRFQDLNTKQSYEDAKKEFAALEAERLEEMEKQLDEEKQRLETELELKKAKSTPEYYSSMGTLTLRHEYLKALKEHSPQAEIIKQELDRRMSEMFNAKQWK